MKVFVFGSAGYPLPKSMLNFCFSDFTSSSLFSFANIEAAATIGWLKSALCSQDRVICFGFSNKS